MSRTPERDDNRGPADVHYKQPLSPERVKSEIDYLRRLLDDIEESYPWALNYGYQRDNSQGEKVKSSGVSDPTALTATSDFMVSARRECSTASHAISKAATLVYDAHAALTRVLGPKLTVEDLERNDRETRRRAPKLKKEELEHLKAMQAKRGPSYGVS